MAKGMPATAALQQAGIAFMLHEYDCDPDAEQIAMQIELTPADLMRALDATATDLS
jgi:prolyl-tRNA editing enzyme YbaK/EbsC (Cys-tRNA(Pro) deacylase)